MLRAEITKVDDCIISNEGECYCYALRVYLKESDVCIYHGIFSNLVEIAYTLEDFEL